MYMEVMRHAYNILVGKPEGNEFYGKPWCRWGENTDTDHIAIGCGLILLLQESAHWFDGDGIQH